MKVFLTFGSHNDNIMGRRHIDYIYIMANKIKELDIFDEINIYTRDYLYNDNEFWKQHGDFIINNKKGFGYWIWKPYLIKKTIEKLNDGDIILYLDAQNEIIFEEKEYLLNYIELLKTNKIFSKFYNGYTNEFINSKMDLIYKLNMQNDELLNISQFEANIQLIYVCQETKDFYNTYYDLACDYHNINDDPSIIQNHETFIEHRYDQSIFSLLMKKNKYSINTFIDKCLYRRDFFK